MIFLKICKRCGTKIECLTLSARANTKYCSDCKSKSLIVNRANYYQKAKDILKKKRNERYKKEKEMQLWAKIKK